MKIVIVFCLLTLLTGTILVVRSLKAIKLQQNCTGFLKRAADASTISVANQELSRAINYLEKNNLTSGYTSVIWKTPDEDIGFWYNNLKASQDELFKLPMNASPLEKTNVLMKLRETLLEDKDQLTYPRGLAVYPYNTLWCLLLWLAVFLLVYMAWLVKIDK